MLKYVIWTLLLLLFGAVVGSEAWEEPEFGAAGGFIMGFTTSLLYAVFGPAPLEYVQDGLESVVDDLLG